MSYKSSKAGRPTKITPDTVRKLEECFKCDASVAEACAYAGIGRTTYYEECKRNPEFRNNMERVQMYPLIVAKQTLFKGICSGDQKAAPLALRYLELRQPERYTPRRKVETEGDIAATFNLAGRAAELASKYIDSPKDAAQ